MNLLETYNDHSLSTEEKEYLCDIQYEVWHLLGETGIREDKDVTSVVVWASGLYSGVFNDDYDLVGLGKSLLCVEVTITFLNRPPERDIKLVERGDTALIGAAVETLVKNIINHN